MRDSKGSVARPFVSGGGGVFAGEQSSSSGSSKARALPTYSHSSRASHRPQRHTQKKIATLFFLVAPLGLKTSKRKKPHNFKAVSLLHAPHQSQNKAHQRCCCWIANLTMTLHHVRDQHTKHAWARGMREIPDTWHLVQDESKAVLLLGWKIIRKVPSTHLHLYTTELDTSAGQTKIKTKLSLSRTLYFLEDAKIKKLGRERGSASTHRQACMRAS